MSEIFLNCRIQTLDLNTNDLNVNWTSRFENSVSPSSIFHLKILTKKIYFHSSWNGVWGFIGNFVYQHWSLKCTENQKDFIKRFFLVCYLRLPLYLLIKWTRLVSFAYTIQYMALGCQTQNQSVVSPLSIMLKNQYVLFVHARKKLFQNIK